MTSDAWYQERHKNTVILVYCGISCQFLVNVKVGLLFMCYIKILIKLLIVYLFGL